MSQEPWMECSRLNSKPFPVGWAPGRRGASRFPPGSGAICALRCPLLNVFVPQRCSLGMLKEGLGAAGSWTLCSLMAWQGHGRRLRMLLWPSEITDWVWASHRSPLSFGFLTQRTLDLWNCFYHYSVEAGKWTPQRGESSQQVPRGSSETAMAGKGPHTLKDDRKSCQSKETLWKGKDIIQLLKPNSPVYSSSVTWEQ